MITAALWQVIFSPLRLHQRRKQHPVLLELTHRFGIQLERRSATFCRVEAVFRLAVAPSSVKLRRLAFFLSFSVQCVVASFAQENSATNASPTPTPNSGESVQPGVNTNGTLSPII